MSMPFIMKRLGSDINTEVNLSPRTRVQPLDSILYEVGVMFSSHGIKGITLHTVETLTWTQSACLHCLVPSVS